MTTKPDVDSAPTEPVALSNAELTQLLSAVLNALSIWMNPRFMQMIEDQLKTDEDA